MDLPLNPDDDTSISEKDGIVTVRFNSGDTSPLRLKFIELLLSHTGIIENQDNDCKITRDGKWLNPARDDLCENVRKKRCHNGTLTKQR